MIKIEERERSMEISCQDVKIETKKRIQLIYYCFFLSSSIYLLTGFQIVSDMDGYTADADNNRGGAATAADEPIETGLWPPVVNVAPRAILHANATCGQMHREEFCHTIDAHPQRPRKPKCSICDAHDSERKHPIEYVIDDKSWKWWQSPTLNSGAENEYVTITLDLKQVCLLLILRVF